MTARSGKGCVKGRTACFANDMAPSAEEAGIEAELIAFNRHLEAIYREYERILSSLRSSRAG
jgi:hypothetical protein